MLLSTKYFNQSVFTSAGEAVFDGNGEAHADDKVEKILSKSNFIELVEPEKKEPVKKAPVKKPVAKKTVTKKITTDE